MAGDEARKRLERESAALKDAIYGFIKNDQPELAGQVLESYAIVNPGDSDIARIRKMINAALSGEGISHKLKVLSDTETVFILAATNLERNGAVNSVLRKVKLMEENWGHKPLILFCEHNIELRRIISRFKDSGELGKNSRVLNVYDYFQDSYKEGLENKAVYLNPGDGVKRTETGEDVYEVRDGGVLLRKEHFIGFAYCLRLVEYFKDGKREKGVYYDDWGYLNKIREYDPANDKHYFHELFYDTAENLRIEAFYRFVDGENEVKRVILHENGEVIEFTDNAELAALCLNRLISDDKFYLLVVENGLMSKAAMTGRPNAAPAAVVHSAFLEDSYDLKSRPQPFYKYLCENRGKFQGIIFPTQTERDDFYAKYGDTGNAFVIPHPYPDEIIKADFDSRDHKKAVVVARFDSIKRVTEAIDIFRLVVNRLPDVKLEIYGAGSQEGNYRERIKVLKLEENVVIKGFTANPAAVFSGAACSVMTSVAEGFGLTLVESVCNGCPAFAFDIKYGPSDIIEDEKTGFLIPRFDKKAYADKLVTYFNDVGLQRTMSENAYSGAEKFGAGAFMERWFNMTESIRKRAGN